MTARTAPAKPVSAPRRFWREHETIIQLAVVTILIVAVMGWLSPAKFLRYYTFESITFTVPELALLSIAIMIAMLTGGIDLSIIGIANLAAVLAGTLFHHLAASGQTAALGPAAVALGVVVALGVGLAAGALNGFLIAKVRITPILATLGTSQLFTGLATSEAWWQSLPEELRVVVDEELARAGDEATRLTVERLGEVRVEMEAEGGCREWTDAAVAVGGTMPISERAA